MKPNLEVRDALGYTPLHLAVISVPKLGSTRNVKALLMRGASRNSTELKGKVPLDLVEDIPDRPDLTEELKLNLGP